jgi:tetratricopeptide (TPR) repeat protein
MLSAQRLVEIIDQSEKAVFTVFGYNQKGLPTDVSSGFFISSDGLAITKASLFYKSDSAFVTGRNNRSYAVERIISVHPYSNLALIKVNQLRQREFSYLQPSKNALHSTEEVLILSHPEETEEGISVGRISRIGSFPFVNRYASIDAELGYKSFGSPVLNGRGLLVGIYTSEDPVHENVIYSSHLLNDTAWVDMNVRLSILPGLPAQHKYLLPHIYHGILFLLGGQNIEAAKALAQHLGAFPDRYDAYCLRALARFRYENQMGGREDIEYANQLNPTGFLAPYFYGLHYLSMDEDRVAMQLMAQSLERNPEFAPAWVEHGRLEWQVNNNIRRAFDEFTRAIEVDSLNGEAYYERGRLSSQYSRNKDLAYEDISQAIYLDPSLPGVFSIRGAMKFANQDFLNAISDFTRALEYDPDDVHAHFNRGIAFFNIGMKEEACRDWKNAGELGNYDAFKYLSRYCSEMKKR